VFGLPIFTTVEIDGDTLVLGVPDMDRLRANMRMFAEANDIFSVWCDCDAKTRVLLDWQYLGQAPAFAESFHLNPNTGQSEVVQR